MLRLALQLRKLDRAERIGVDPAMPCPRWSFPATTEPQRDLLPTPARHRTQNRGAWTCPIEATRDEAAKVIMIRGLMSLLAGQITIWDTLLGSVDEVPHPQAG